MDTLPKTGRVIWHLPEKGAGGREYLASVGGCPAAWSTFKRPIVLNWSSAAFQRSSTHRQYCRLYSECNCFQALAATYAFRSPDLVVLSAKWRKSGTRRWRKDCFGRRETEERWECWISG